MKTGVELGAALALAMERKQVRQHHVADEFGVRQPSVSEWLRFGRISKRHIPHLVSYFSDVVGPEHWGLPANWAEKETPALSPEVMEIALKLERLQGKRRRIALAQCRLAIFSGEDDPAEQSLESVEAEAHAAPATPEPHPHR